MNRFKKASALIIIAEILIIISLNLIYSFTAKESINFYRVEIKRVAKLLEYEDISNIDLSRFETILRVSEFDPDEICNNDYAVEEVNNHLYRIEYSAGNNSKPLGLMNTGLLLSMIITVLVLLYLGLKVIAPFDKMTSLTEELAKGNLSNPIKAEKSRFFGKFLWGMDMLRENLEDSKTKNLEYQKEKKTMLLSLSHDIKTPLSAIKLYAKALSDDIYDTDEKKQQALDGILLKTDEIKGYVDEIYNMSREDFIKLEVNIKTVYLQSIIEGVAAYYKDKLSVIHTELEVFEYDNVLLLADPDRLIEALQNLMENAIKYGDGKKISISFDEEEDCKLITVTNTGCSLEQSELSNIFDSFYRGSNTANISGNGLGLYIVKQLMLKMDGDVFANVIEDTFNVTLVVKKA